MRIEEAREILKGAGDQQTGAEIVEHIKAAEQLSNIFFSVKKEFFTEKGKYRLIKLADQ